jgi:hypothetical protein
MMAGALTKLLEVLTGHNHHEMPEQQPLDKIQLDAAQDRLTTRTAELDASVDELSQMIKRMKRRETRSKQ